MEKIVEEKETKIEEKVEEKKDEKKVVLKKESLKSFAFTVEAKNEQIPPKEEEEKVEQEAIVNSYVSNFENKTIEDIKKEQDKLEKEKEPQEKEEVEETQEEVIEEITERKETPDEIKKKLVIEKPNYDFIPEKKGKTKKKSKLKTVAVACALAVATIGTVAGSIVIDNLQTSYIELQDEYSLNLLTYLRNITNLNTTNSSLDFLETYPEDLTAPSNIGESSNWFNNLTDFVSGIFGG